MQPSRRHSPLAQKRNRNNIQRTKLQPTASPPLCACTYTFSLAMRSDGIGETPFAMKDKRIVERKERKRQEEEETKCSLDC